MNETLEEWLEAWEREYLDGQTRISREEAIKRWEAEQGPKENDYGF